MNEGDLGALLQKLKANREKVPTQMLKTKYAAAYGRLKAQINEALKEEASRIPEWALPGQPVPPWFPEIVGGIFARALDSSLAKLRTAVYRHYDAAEALSIAREVNRRFVDALAGYVGGCSCLVVDMREPDKPKIYNYYLGMYWEDTGTWREPREDEAVPDTGSLWEGKK